jgi:DNA-binding NarL/FixJ family response regulator
MFVFGSSGVAMSEVKCKIYLLAENRLFREALCRILSKRNDFQVTGAAPVSDVIFDTLAELKPEIILADSSILSMSRGLLLTKLRQRVPSTKIVMIGMDLDPAVFLQTVREGVFGYVLKDASAAEVANAIRVVINNEAFCPQSLLQPLFNAVANSKVENSLALVKRELGLSRREQQLTRMIGEGLTNKEIACQLNLSEQTIKNHVHRMLRKVGAKDRLTIVERWEEVRKSENIFSA